jgi:hypothetical protein
MKKVVLIALMLLTTAGCGRRELEVAGMTRGKKQGLLLKIVVL